VARRQPVEFMKCVALRVVLLYLLIIGDVSFVAKFGQIHELVRRYGEVE